MRIVIRGVLAVCAVASFALTTLGQSAGQGTTNTHVGSPRQPYTAKFTITNVRTLSNGSTITSQSTRTEARDSQGRRLIITTREATGEIPERTTYDLTDLKAGATTRWSVPGKAVTVQNMPSGSGCWSSSIAASMTTPAPNNENNHASVGTMSVSSTAAVAHPAERPIEEDLGTQTIQGLEAQGTRTTQTKPVGMVGNDAPLVTTNENWFARGYGLLVRSIHDDPENGKNTIELTEFTPGEPDPALFQSPEGYEVRTVQLHQVPCER